MSARANEGRQSTKDVTESPQSELLESTTTLALERTLAVPMRPRILDDQLLGHADTLDLRFGEGATASSPQPRGIEAPLRDPVAGDHFPHAYDTDSLASRELGRGGIGRVVLVFDRTLGRDVAMKELLPELLSSEEPAPEQNGITLTERFLREARITGQLEHPNIVPVYELGRQPKGCLYYTMRVVRGRTLASAIEQATTMSARLALVNHFAGLCQAIAYAHSRGVVHRDIKPENVMIGEFGETCVLDWGLANIVEEASPQSLRAASTLSCPPQAMRRTVALTAGTAASGHTQVGSIVGTPMYMSPEQLLQQSDGCTPTADVWSLGVVLYFILTGQLPFAANNLGNLIVRMRTSDWQPIEIVAPDVPRDLAAIARRALTHDPRARYQNAGEMARDIAAYQAGGKVTAYEYSSYELLRRFARRNRSSVLVAATALTTLVLLAVSSYRRISAARDVAVAAEQRAMSGEQRAKASLSDVLLERARTELADGDPANATLLAAGSLELLERPEARGMLIQMSNADGLEPLGTLAPSQACESAAWNTTLELFACSRMGKVTLSDFSARHNAATSSNVPIGGIFSLEAAGWLLAESTRLTRFDRNFAKPVAHQPEMSPALVFASDSTGEHFATVDQTGRVQVWSSVPNALPQVFLSPKPITAIAFHPNEPTLALGGHHGDLYLWSWQDNARPIELGNTHATVRALAFKPKSNQLASGGADGSVLLWDTLQRQLIQMPLRASSAIVGLSYSPTAALLAVSLRSGILEILDTKTYDRRIRATTGFASIGPFTFTSKSELLGIADGATPLRFRIRQADPAPRHTARGNVLSLTWASNGTDILVAGLGEHGLCHLHLSDGTCGDRLPLRTALVRIVAHSADNALFAVAGTGGKIEIWDSAQKIPRGFLDVPIPEVRALAFIPQTHRLAVGGNAPTLVILDLDSMQQVAQQALPGAVQSMAVLDQQKLLALGLRNGHVLFRSLQNDSIMADLQHGKGWPIGMALLAQPDRLLVVEDSGQIAIFGVSSRQLIHSINTGEGRLTAFAYDPKSGLIATGGEAREVVIISTSKSQLGIVARMQEHQGTVRSLLFDSTNRRLFSSGDDATIRLWPLQSLDLPASDWLRSAERDHGIRLESGRIVRQTPTP